MKAVFLNVLNGEISGIDEFIKSQSSDTDIFCFQEANEHFLDFCRENLKNYQLFFACKEISDLSTTKGFRLPQAIFVKKGIKVNNVKELLDGNPNMGFALCTQILLGEKVLNVCNVHGIPLPGDKLDTKERLEQSQKIIDYCRETKGFALIGGDFNLMPQIESVNMFKKNGYRDLIEEYAVKTTRNEIAWKNYPNNKQYYSDYVFVSPELKVQQFSVPNIEVSDHLPLILEFEI